MVWSGCARRGMRSRSGAKYNITVSESISQLNAAFINAGVDVPSPPPPRQRTRRGKSTTLGPASDPLPAPPLVPLDTKVVAG